MMRENKNSRWDKSPAFLSCLRESGCSLGVFQAYWSGIVPLSIWKNIIPCVFYSKKIKGLCDLTRTRPLESNRNTGDDYLSFFSIYSKVCYKRICAGNSAWGIIHNYNFFCHPFMPFEHFGKIFAFTDFNTFHDNSFLCCYYKLLLYSIPYFYEFFNTYSFFNEYESNCFLNLKKWIIYYILNIV